MSTRAKNRMSFYHQIQIVIWDAIIFLLSKSKPAKKIICFTFKKKKSVISLLIFLCFGCMIAGLIFFPIENVESSPIVNKGCTSNQCNYIIIHTNQLNKQESQLFSIWIVFLNLTDTPQMIWKPVDYSRHFPVNQPVNFDKIFDSKDTFSQEFEQIVNNLDFHCDGFIVVDEFAADKLINWSTGIQENPYQLNLSQNIELSEEIRLSNDYCNRLSSNDQNIKSIDENWDEIYPKHLFMNIEFDEFLHIWNLIKNSSEQVHCEVLVEQ